MAKLIFNTNNVELPDGAPIASFCQSQGVPFNCHTGVCGSCVIQVISGQDCLTDLTEEELDLGLDASRRLACRCSIKRGTVVIAA